MYVYFVHEIKTNNHIQSRSSVIICVTFFESKISLRMNPGPLGREYHKKKSTCYQVIKIGKYTYVPYYGSNYTFININKCV